MIKVFLSVILAGSFSVANDSVSWNLPMCPNGVGALDCSFSQKLTICSQSKYNALAGSIMGEAPSCDAVSYHQFSRDEAINVLGSNQVTYVTQGEAKIRTNPKEGDYFATHSLMDCVGISIWTPSATLFSHMDIQNIVNGKLGRLLDRVKDVSSARVTLVSVFKSQVLSSVLGAFRNRGYRNISLDVENGVMLFFPDHTEKIYAVESLGLTLKQVRDVSLAQLETMIKVPSVSIRGFIVNAKTGQAYTFVSREMRENDHQIIYGASQIKLGQ